MQLKLVTFDKHNYSVSTQLINLEGSISVEYRSLITNEFSPSNNRIPSMVSSDIVALIFQDHSDSIIKISKHQGAYLLDSSKTVELINKPSDFDDIKIWIKYEEEGNWEIESLANYVEGIRYRRTDWNYVALPKDTNPNAKIQQKPIEEMVTVTWYRDLRQTSQSWRKWDDFAKMIDTRHLQTVVVREDQDPNQSGFKLT